MKYLKTFNQLNEGNIKDMEKKFSDYLKDSGGDIFELEKEMVEMMKDLLNLLIEKYEIEKSNSDLLDISILKQIEDKDPDNALLDIKKTPLKFHGSDEEFMLKDILLQSDGEYSFNIDYDNEENTQNVYAGFHLVYPIYALILTLLNKEAMSSMNENLIDDVESYTKERKSISGRISELRKKKEELDKKYSYQKDKLIGHIYGIIEHIESGIINSFDSTYDDIDDYLDQNKVTDSIAKALHFDPDTFYIYTDHGDVLIESAGDTYVISDFNIDQIFHLFKTLISIPEISTYYNSTALKTLNELHDYSNTRSNYLIKTSKLLNSLIVSYDLFDKGDKFSLGEALKEKGIDIEFKGLKLYPSVELHDIIAEKEKWGYKFIAKCENIVLPEDGKFEVPIDDLVRRKSAVNLFNAISRAINTKLLKDINN